MVLSTRMRFEFIFAIIYLIINWGLIVLMLANYNKVSSKNKNSARAFCAALSFLAFGDTYNLILKIMANKKGIEENIIMVEMGYIASAVAVTFFCIMLLEAWKARFYQKYNWIFWILFCAASIRLIIMIFPQNTWGSASPPSILTLCRNMLLLITGLSTGLLILWDSIKANDKIFKWIGIMTTASWVFYIPVMIFLYRFPLVEIFIIPHKLIHMGIGFASFIELYVPVWFHQQSIEENV